MPAPLNPKQKELADKVTAASKEWVKAKKAEDLARTQLDRAIAQSVKNGITYRQVASAVGMSVAWVQGSLVRSGVIDPPKPRTKPVVKAVKKPTKKRVRKALAAAS